VPPQAEVKVRVPCRRGGGVDAALAPVLGKGAIDKEVFMKNLSEIAHRRLHSGNGFDGKFASQERGVKGGMWNFLMRMFMQRYSDRPNKAQIDDFVLRLGRFFFGS
jgi:hypothetical protein